MANIISTALENSTYLFVWNSKRDEFVDYESLVKEFQSKGECIMRWRCNQRIINLNSRAFLLKIGKYPKGIVGSGIIISHPLKNAVDIKFDKLLNYEESILSIETLKTGILAKQNWTPQASSRLITQEIAGELEKAWAEYTGKSVKDVIKEKEPLTILNHEIEIKVIKNTQFVYAWGRRICNLTDFNKHVKEGSIIILPSAKISKIQESENIESDSDEKEQIEIITNLKYQEKSKEDILNELKDLEETDPEIIIINGKSFKRDNKRIALIKILRDFNCQICNKTIIKKDGTKYIEAAHIIPKHQNGRETLDNIMLLCPNHHKEFDLGNRVIINQTPTNIEFSINGEVHNLSFINY